MSGSAAWLAASRAPAARSAAAVRGWAARKKRAQATAIARLAMSPAERTALQGSQADRAMAPGEIKRVIDGAIASLRAREGQ